jgi:hypothetical protein
MATTVAESRAVRKNYMQNVRPANGLRFHQNVDQRRDPMLAAFAAGRIVNTRDLEEATLQALAKLDMGESNEILAARAEYHRREAELQHVLDTGYVGALLMLFSLAHSETDANNIRPTAACPTAICSPPAAHTQVRQGRRGVSCARGR